MKISKLIGTLSVCMLALYSIQASAAIITIDPDNYIAGTDISNARDGVTLSSVPLIDQSARDPIFATDWNPTTGNVIASPENRSIAFYFDYYRVGQGIFELTSIYRQISYRFYLCGQQAASQRRFIV